MSMEGVMGLPTIMVEEDISQYMEGKMAKQRDNVEDCPVCKGLSYWFIGLVGCDIFVCSECGNLFFPEYERKHVGKRYGGKAKMIDT